MSEATIPTGRRERRKQEIRDRMRAAARTLFDQKGFEATTVDEICALADVAQKTFFNYFPTKHHVVREIADEFLADVGGYVEEARKRPGSTAERLEHVFRRAGEEALRAGPRHKELVIEVARHSSNAPSAMPVATLASMSEMMVSSGIRPTGVPRFDGSPSASVRASGTNASRTLKWWLPVPHRPDAHHVSSISTSLGGNTMTRNGVMRPSSTKQWAKIQSACWQPLAKAQRPLTR